MTPKMSIGLALAIVARTTLALMIEAMMFWGAVRLVAGLVPHSVHQKAPLSTALDRSIPDPCSEAGYEYHPTGKAWLTQSEPSYSIWSVECRSAISGDTTNVQVSH